MMTQTVLLGDLLIDLAMGPFGSNLKVDNFVDSGVPVIKGGNLYSQEVDGDFSFVSEEKAYSLKRSLAYPDDIVITHRGTLGQVSIVPHGKHPYYLVSQSQLRLTPDKDKINPRYLLYYLRSPIGQHELMQHAAQVGVPSIATPTKAVKSFKIILPDLDTQRRIADILGTIDEKIELHRKMNETLEQMGQALFRHYFIDNPEARNWEEVYLKDFGKIITGKTPPTKQAELYGGEYLFLKIPDMTQLYPLKTIISLSDAGYEKQKPYLLPKNSLNVSCIGTVGLMTINKVPLSTNQNINSIIPNSIHSLYYLYFALKPNIKEILNSLGAGSVFSTVSKSKFEKISLRLPCEGKLQDFHETILPIMDQIYLNTSHNQTLITLRETLLPQLINGKIQP